MNLIKVKIQHHGDESGYTEVYIDDETGNLYVKVYEYNYSDGTVSEKDLQYVKKLTYSELYKELEHIKKYDSKLKVCNGSDNCDFCKDLKERNEVLKHRLEAGRITGIYTYPKPIGKIKYFKSLVESGEITKKEYKKFTGEKYEI